jgi:hypothetical protein
MTTIDNGLTKDQMLGKYEVLGFAFGYTVVKDRETGKKGTLDFGDYNGVRYYYNFQEA